MNRLALLSVFLALPVFGCSFLGEVIKQIPTPRPVVTPTATQTAEPTATATAAPRPTVVAVVQPPAFCLVNGGDGFHHVQNDLGLLDSTWWFYMGQEWKQQNPQWGGGDCAPCDKDHGLAFDGPCNGREWGTAEGTRFKITGPGVVATWKNAENPAQQYVQFRSGLINVELCPSANMIDAETGQLIPSHYRTNQPEPWGTDSRGCRHVSFVTP